MKKRSRIVLGLLLAAAAAGVLLWLEGRPREPEYQGRKLTSWLEDHLPRSGVNPPYNSPGWKQADEALRRIGTNAIPTLLDMIRAKDPPPAILKVLDWAGRQRLWRFRYRRAERRNEEAEYAFETLGTNAAAAVPGLIAVYEENRSPSSHRCAAMALGHIGPPAQAAVPVLVRDFHHADSQVRFPAVSAVIYIGGNPAVVVPALRSVLKDDNVGVRWNAIVALSMFGGRARAAVPDLLEGLNDPAIVGTDPIKEQVETALWRIAPEKVGKPLMVEDSTPIVADGVTVEALDVVFKGERHTLIRKGTPLPCVAQVWFSDPRPHLELHRSAGPTSGRDHFLGRFEVLGVSPSADSVNVSTLCVIAGRQVFLCARDNTARAFLEIRKVENGVSP